jgi:hypothetical protein
VLLPDFHSNQPLVLGTGWQSSRDNLIQDHLAEINRLARTEVHQVVYGRGFSGAAQARNGDIGVPPP